jgi:hypothetical protein
VIAAARSIPSVRHVSASGARLSIAIDDPRRDTPELVRTLVGAGAEILEVHERAASLEDVYFEVMGRRPARDGA